MDQYTYSKDNRTNEQYKHYFEIGKYNENLVFDRLSCDKFQINREEKFLLDINQKYCPDCFIRVREAWYPTEIKFTDKEPNDKIELKKNQVDKLKQIGGIFIFSTPTKYLFISALSASKYELINGFCNKPCYRVRDIKWNYWRKPIKCKNY